MLTGFKSFFVSIIWKLKKERKNENNKLKKDEYYD